MHGIYTVIVRMVETTPILIRTHKQLYSHLTLSKSQNVAHCNRFWSYWDPRYLLPGIEAHDRTLSNILY